MLEISVDEIYVNAYTSLEHHGHVELYLLHRNMFWSIFLPWHGTFFLTSDSYLRMCPQFVSEEKTEEKRRSTVLKNRKSIKNRTLQFEKGNIFISNSYFKQAIP